MAKIIGLDIGGKRTGVAETDFMKIIASPKETIATETLMDYLAQAFTKEPVEALVIGEPTHLHGGDSHNSERVRHYEKLIRETYPKLQVVLIDERFTSKMASQALVHGGMRKSKRQDKSQLDKVSAAIILQSYLDSK